MPGKRTPSLYSTAEGQKRLMAESMGLPPDAYTRKIDTRRAGDHGADPTMPEFILNDDRPLSQISDMERGYIEAMFFTNCDTGAENEQLANELGTRRLTRKSLAAIRRDCDKFAGTVMPDGCFARQWLDRVESYDDEQAGRDLWFSRQGHGVGFWSRDDLEANGIGDALHAAAEGLGETYVDVYRGWIHHP